MIEEKRVARVGGEVRFNRVKGADNSYTNAVEAWLAIVEQHAAPAIERLIVTRARPSKADRITIAFYLALQSGRTPLGLQRVQQVADVIVEAHVALLTHDEEQFAETCRRAGIDETAEVIEDLRQRMAEVDGVKIKDPRSYAFQLAIQTAGGLTNVIAPTTWTLLESETPLVVGDHPITHYDNKPPRYPWTEPTWRSSPTAEGFLPLTTTVALRMSHPNRRRDPDFGVGGLVASDAAKQNVCCYGWASRFVFAEDKTTLEHLHEHARSNPQGIPRASHQYQVMTADERAFRHGEPNEQPEGWPSHVPRPGRNGEIELCRYRVVRTDQVEEMRAAVKWALTAEGRLHPEGRPKLESFGRDDAVRRLLEGQMSR